MTVKEFKELLDKNLESGKVDPESEMYIFDTAWLEYRKLYIETIVVDHDKTICIN